MFLMGCHLMAVRSTGRLGSTPHRCRWVVWPASVRTRRSCLSWDLQSRPPVREHPTVRTLDVPCDSEPWNRLASAPLGRWEVHRAQHRTARAGRRRVLHRRSVLVGRGLLHGPWRECRPLSRISVGGDRTSWRGRPRPVPRCPGRSGPLFQRATGAPQGPGLARRTQVRFGPDLRRAAGGIDARVSCRYVRRLLEDGDRYTEQLESSDGSEVATPKKYLLGEHNRDAERDLDLPKEMGPVPWRVSGKELTRFIGSRQEKKFRPGYDLTLRPPKSVSIRWALGGPDISAKVREATPPRWTRSSATTNTTPSGPVNRRPGPCRDRRNHRRGLRPPHVAGG